MRSGKSGTLQVIAGRSGDVYAASVKQDDVSLDITGSLGTELSGRTIVLAVCGSVAAVKAPEVGRELMRRGATVRVVMSAAAQRFVGPELLHWATGSRPIVEIGGETEHVALVGNHPGRADLLLIFPATANTVGKMACGIDDGPVTTFATTAIGEGVPVIVAPGMHEPMYRHPVVRRNLETLREIGVEIVPPVISEGKAKAATPEQVCEAVIRRLSPRTSGEAGARGSLAGRRVLITAGRTVEYIDPIRVITNNSSGKMGMALAAAALEAGAEVTVIYGKGSADPPARARVLRVDTAEEMSEAVRAELTSSPAHDVVIAAAAVGDWRPVRREAAKISTRDHDRITLVLEPTPKIIDRIKDDAPAVFLVAFRAQHDLSLADLLADARERARLARADLIAVNDVSHPGAGFETDTNEMYLIAADGTESHIPRSPKLEVARRIIVEIGGRLLPA